MGDGTNYVKTNYKLIKDKFTKTRKERDKESKQLKLNK